MNVAIYNKQFWMSNVLTVVSLCMVLWFPTEDILQSILSGVVFLIIVPWLFVRFFLRETTSFLSLSSGNVVQGGVWLLAGLLSVGLFLAGILHYTDIITKFTIPLAVRSHFLVFLLYVFIAGVYVFIFEFFFRGFVLSVWKKVIGIRAVAVQAIVFTGFLLAGLHGKMNLMVLFIIITAIFSGFIVARSRSILYSFLFSYISAILMIVSVILFAK